MTEFVTIEESKQKFLNGESKSASFVATAIQKEEPQGNKQPYRFLLDDGRTQEKITVWPDDVSKIKVGSKYEFNGPYWKDYKGTPQVSVSQYTAIKEIEISENQQKIDITAPPQILEPKQIIPSRDELPKLGEGSEEAVTGEAITLLQIRRRVAETVKKYEVDPHPGMIWEMTAQIYETMFKKNFEREEN